MENKKNFYKRVPYAFKDEKLYNEFVKSLEGRTQQAQMERFIEEGLDRIKNKKHIDSSDDSEYLISDLSEESEYRKLFPKSKTMNTGYAIRIIRKNLELSQEDFGKLVKVGKSTIISWEGGRKKPKPNSIRDVLRKLSDQQALMSKDKDVNEAFATLEAYVND